MIAPAQLKIAPAIHPFAREGSWTSLKVDRREGAEILSVLDLHGRRMWAGNRVFRIAAVRGGRVLSAPSLATPGRLFQQGDGWTLEAAYDGADVIRLRVRGAGLKVTRTAPPDKSVMLVQVNDRVARLQQGGFPHYAATCLSGTMSCTGPSLHINTMQHGVKPAEFVQSVEVAPADGVAELALENHLNQWEVRDYPRSFDECVKEVQDEFTRWCVAGSQMTEEWHEAWLTAEYTCWSSIANPRGLLRRRVIIESKNIMHSIWSWGVQFYGMTYAKTHPELAWNNWMVMYDNMDRDGGIPSLFNDVTCMWGFPVIPISGWAYLKMAAANPDLATPDHLHEVARVLTLNTRWWFRFKDDDKDGVPEINHGNDLGTDNATDIDMGGPAISPAGCTYLITQMDALAWIHARLGNHSQANDWRLQADCLLSKMLARLWDGKRFNTVRVKDNFVNPASSCHTRFMPLAMGSRLPSEIRSILIKDLRSALTPVGIPSEDIQSNLYLSDSYWRGPVWAPPTLLAGEGLRDAGEFELADEIARRYCANAAKVGFWENYDAETGRGLKDSGMPWTAAPFIYLARKLSSASNTL